MIQCYKQCSRYVSEVYKYTTVVSGATRGGMCDLDSVSRRDIVGGVDEMSLPGGGDTVVSGVDEPVCGVSSVRTASELDVCGVKKR